MQDNETVWLIREILNDEGEIERKRYCAKCNYNGIKVYEGWRYCPMCGRKVRPRGEQE